MKEAAGEANMTVITIVLIGIIAAVGATIVPGLLNGVKNKTCCTQNNGIWFENGCYNRANCTVVSGKATSCTGTAFTPKC